MTKTPAETIKYDQLVLEKQKAGLNRTQAEAVAEQQIRLDRFAEEEEAKIRNTTMPTSPSGPSESRMGAHIRELDAEVARLIAENADLQKQLADAKATPPNDLPKTPSGDGKNPGKPAKA